VVCLTKVKPIPVFTLHFFALRRVAFVRCSE
jgi:hypothetical protein